MNLFVTTLGAVAIVIGLVGVVSPRSLVKLVQSFGGPTRFWCAVVLRAIMGIVLIVVASECKFPIAVRIIGGITILAALIILACGQQRLDATIDWWIAGETKVRCSGLFAIAMGVLFVYIAG